MSVIVRRTVAANERSYHHPNWTNRRPPSRRRGRLVRSPLSHQSWTNFSGPDNTYGYDGLDRLTAATGNGSSGCTSTSTYTYDGLDRQTSSLTGSTTTTVHDDGMSQTPLTETTTGHTPVTYQLDSNGVPVAAESSAGTELLDTDGNGNITTIANPATGSGGRPDCTARFDPFGNPEQATTRTNTDPVCSTGSATTDVFYNATRRDSATGEYQFGSRTYDPTHDNYFQPDSYRDQGANPNLSIHVDPLTENTYTYVNGDPLNLTDPNGHLPCTMEGAGDSACAGNIHRLVRLARQHDRAEAAGQIENLLSTGGSIATKNTFTCIDAAIMQNSMNAGLSGFTCGFLGAPTRNKDRSIQWTYTSPIGATVRVSCNYWVGGAQGCVEMIGGVVTSAGGTAAAMVLVGRLPVATDGSDQPIPNPWGRLGSPAHQEAVQTLARAINSNDNLTAKTEFMVKTPNGAKSVRFVDVAAVDPENPTTPIRFYQVGLQTKSGIPVARERTAISDISDVFPDVPTEFVPYNVPGAADLKAQLLMDEGAAFAEAEAFVEAEE